MQDLSIDQISVLFYLDLRESRRIEEIADSVFLIYRDEVYNKEENNPNKGKAEIIIAKNKNGWAGSVRMEFIGHCTRFEDEIQSSNLVETRSGDMSGASCATSETSASQI